MNGANLALSHPDNESVMLAIVTFAILHQVKGPIGHAGTSKTKEDDVVYMCLRQSVRIPKSVSSLRVMDLLCEIDCYSW